MRHLSKLFFLCLLLAVPAAGVATAATTAAQLVELMKAGLSDDILIALIQTDGSTFQLSAPEILALHREGLSERVILAMQETARRKIQERSVGPVAVGAVEPRADSSQAFQQVVEPIAPQPTAVNVTQTVTQTVEAPQPAYYPSYYPSFYPVIAVPVVTPARVHSVVTRPVAPIYWGWGGQRRPDSWNDGRLVATPPPVIKR